MKRNSKVMSIVAVAVCVVALSVGFAAFSNTLTIQSSATVTPNESDFKVVFSTSYDSATAGNAIKQANLEAGAPELNITANSTTLTIPQVTLKNPGESVTYQFYAYNAGKYTAYLNKTELANVVGEASKKTCTDTSSLAAEACEDIEVTVHSYYEVFLIENMTGKNNSELYDEFYNQAYEAKILPGQSIPVNVTISYPSDATRSDEEFGILFGDIELLFESVD